MKAVILAGGIGSRLMEETNARPKPMVEIGGKPILWHIMKTYSHHGINDFIVCLGYRGYVIKEYFANYFLHMSDVTIDIAHNSIEVHERHAEPWRVTLVDTGMDSQTGGRLGRIRGYVAAEDAFCMTYGDGVGDIDVRATIEYHRSHGRLATVTATQPPGRFGVLETDGERVLRMKEKPLGDGGWINGGFFVLSPKVLDRIAGDSTIWEAHPMVSLAEDDQLRAWRHPGFWHPMDTLRDRHYLEELWAKGRAPWRVWA
jgi:glucose-1-phosphate cytidylyltransferase